jgi:hypothetical protein
VLSPPALALVQDVVPRKDDGHALDVQILY